MAIEGYENFTYIGYTLGRTKPTLYFKEGRYTQEHDEPNNVGWHPVDDKVHHQLNISHEEVTEIMAIEVDDPEEQTFCRKILVKGVVTGDRNLDTAKLFECDVVDSTFFNIHVSGGKLIIVDSPGFKGEYGESYAKEVLSRGSKAPNEMEQHS